MATTRAARNTSSRSTKGRKQNTRNAAQSRSHVTKRGAKPAPKATTTAIAKTPIPAETRMVRSEPQTINKRFQRAAERLDLRIVETGANIGRQFVALGELADEMSTTGGYRALGFSTVSDYFNNRFPDRGASQIFQAMRVVRNLTQGDRPVITREDAREIPQASLETMVRLKQEGVKVTTEMIESAKSLPSNRFNTEVAYPKSPALATRAAARAGDASARSGSNPAGTVTRATQGQKDGGDGAQGEQKDGVSQGVVMTRVQWDLQTETLADLKHCEEIARYVTRDADQSIPWRDRFIQSMCAEYIATHEPEYNQWRETQEAAGEHAENITKETMALGTVNEEDLEEEILVAEDRHVEYEGKEGSVVNEAEYVDA